MIAGIPKISVRIICYKQQELIKRAINSLLSQVDYIYEICVSDDCSPDNTWGVLQEYDRQYPGLFKLHRNEPNLGIMQNIEQAWTMPTGDIVYNLAGDDECGQGWFKRVIDYIRDNNIDYKHEDFCIYGDYAAVYPNGDKVIIRNNLVNSGLDMLSLAFRGLICNRSACFSINVLHKYKKASQGRSQIAESALDRQLQVFAKRNYYIPYLGNLYHTGVGVSSTNHLNKTIVKEREMQYGYTIEFLTKLGATISSKDVLFLESLTLSQTILLDETEEEKAKHRRIQKEKKRQGYDSAYEFKTRKYKRMIFTILRKLPHSTPWSIKI